MRGMMNVLIVRTSSMGDLIHTWPALTELKTHYPNLSLTWLVEDAFADIAALHPAVGRVIPFSWRRWRRAPLSPATWREVRACKQALADGGWDQVIDLQGLVKSAIPARWGRAPLAGYDRKSIREPLACLFYDKTYAASWQLPAIERCRRLLSQVFGYTSDGAPRFGVPAPAKPTAAPEMPYVVLLHATSRDSKLWPETHWIALGTQLAERHGWSAVLPWGNDKERQRAERLAAALPGALVPQRMGLRDAAGLLGHAEAVVGVDTGLLHLANALDVPLVGIYTDTDPAATGVVETARSANLGGERQCPSVDIVYQTLLAMHGAPR